MLWRGYSSTRASRSPWGAGSRAGQRVFGGVGRGAFGFATHPLLDSLEDVLADDLGQRDRVLAVEAGPAQPGLRLLGGGDHALQRHVAERVRADRGADALVVEAVGDEFGLGREVNAVEARPLHRRCGDADVHLDGA